LKEIALRRAEPADYFGIKRLLTESELYDERTDSRREFSEVLRCNKKTCIVAQKNGKVVGVILGTYDGWHGILHHLAVARTYRRRGIGAELVAECIRSLRLRGAHRVYCHIKSSNKAALLLFRQKFRFSAHRELILHDREALQGF
jgi:ribosomal protein S18 acetylase RimI-like enzyme